MGRARDDTRPHLCTCQLCSTHENQSGQRGVYRSWLEHQEHVVYLGLRFAERDEAGAVDMDVDVNLAAGLETLVIDDSHESPSNVDGNDQLQDQAERRGVALGNGFQGQGEQGLISGPIPFDNGRYCNWPLSDEHEAVQIVMFISVFCSLVFSLSRNLSDILLALLRCLVETTLKCATSEKVARYITTYIPKDSRTARSRYHMGGGNIIYAVCPKCHATYEPIFASDSSEPTYPVQCSYESTSRMGACNEQLLDKDKRPLKKFVYNSVLDFIGGLVSRPIIEGLVDGACDNLLRPCNVDNTEIRGPFQAEFLRNFEGPQPRTRFIDRGDEIRLAFSVCVDFFNIEGVKSGAASVSCGIIALACLNLPEEIRYKHENMYLAGIIPGPKEPRLSEINPYLAPLVEEFLVLWNQGVRFSQTASATRGRTVRAAIAMLVCDLPAARKVAGFMAHSSNTFLCSHCKCCKKDIGNVDRDFERRETVVIREGAMAWRDAGTKTVRSTIQKQYGVRWSELWRLPYWDPSKQLVVDPMHCLLLGLVQNHFTRLLPLTEKAISGPAPVMPPYEYDFEQVPSREEDPENPIYQDGNEFTMSDSDIQQVSEIHNLLLAPIYSPDNETFIRLRDALARRTRPALLFVWKSLDLPVGTLVHPDDIRGGQPRNAVKKVQLAGALARWRFQKPFVSNIPSVKLTTTGLLHHIRHVISHTSKPTWVRSVPLNFGDSSAGKIKADEWRTLSTIYLPLALTSYLFFGDEPMDYVTKERFETVLNHTMELIQAVSIVFRPSISKIEMEKYNKHIKTYVGSLRSIHPNASLLPNMHMATHIADFLPLFGSVYSWWTFPFERLIGVLQNLPSNSKIGQLETTILNAFIATSKLKQCIHSRDAFPQGVQACISAIEAFLPEYTETVQHLDSDDRIPLVEHIDPEEFLEKEKNSNKKKIRSRCKWNDVEYSTRQRHVGNSQIVFRVEGSNVLIPGFIERITDGEEPNFMVKRLSAVDTNEDCFVRWEDFPMALFRTTLSPPEFISCRAVRGHFAAVKLGDQYYAALPLFKL